MNWAQGARPLCVELDDSGIVGSARPRPGAEKSSQNLRKLRLEIHFAFVIVLYSRSAMVIRQPLTLHDSFSGPDFADREDPTRELTTNAAKGQRRESRGDLGDIGPLGPLAANMLNAYARLSKDRLAPFEIIPVQFAILDLCFRGQADTVMGLARLVPIDAAGISRNVDRLVKRGLIQRRRSRSDRRVVRLALTEEGMAVMPRIMERLQEVNSILLRGVTQEEMRGFMSMLQKVTANSEGGQ